jgi:hypothetical protein
VIVLCEEAPGFRAVVNRAKQGLPRCSRQPLKTVRDNIAFALKRAENAQPGPSASR